MLICPFNQKSTAPRVHSHITIRVFTLSAPLNRACSVAGKVLGAKKMNHGQRVALQQAISNTDRKLDVEAKYCVPRLADKTQKQEHFYNDTFKFSVCLPTKTGCTNWQRGLGKFETASFPCGRQKTYETYFFSLIQSH